MWDPTVRSRLIDSEPRHLMGHKPERRGLDHKILYRHTRIVERVAIRRAILELQFRHREQQYRRTAGPCLIAFDQTVEQPIVLSLVLFRSHQESPGLTVIR